MNTPHQSIVVGVDGSAGSDQAVRCAARLAAQRNLGLHIVHALCFGQSQYGLAIASGGALFDAVRDDAGRATEPVRAGAGDVSMDPVT